MDADSDTSDEIEDVRPEDNSLNDFVEKPDAKPVPSTSRAAAAALMTPQSTPTSSTDAKQSPAEDDNQVCPICFEPWTSSGEHRLVCLKCGHLFGFSCIDRWLRGRESKCPQCNVKATRKHIRVLFAKRIKMLDTTEKDLALRNLDMERELRRKAEMEAAQTRLKLQVTLADCKRLQDETEQQKQQLFALRAGSGDANGALINNVKNGDGATVSNKFDLFQTVKLNEQGGCRIMSFCPAVLALCIAQPSPNTTLVPGFGVRIVSAAEFRALQYIPVHSKQIKDVAFDMMKPAALMLSCAMDKTVKITNLTSNSIVQSYSTSLPMWSCTWDASNQNVFYTGSANGQVYQYDMRNTTDYVTILNSEGSRSPCVSLEYIHSHGESRLNGIVVGQLDQCTFYEKTGDDFRVHLLPFEGSVTWVSVDEESHHILVTCRPTARSPRVRHFMCHLSHVPSPYEDRGCMGHITSSIVHVFEGGGTQKQLTRNRLIPYPGNNPGILAAATDEATESVLLWDASSARLCQQINIRQSVMDLCAMPYGTTYHLAALTEKQLQLYRYQ